MNRIARTLAALLAATALTAVVAAPQAQAAPSTSLKGNHGCC